MKSTFFSALLTFIFLTCSNFAAQAQWLISGNNILNTNTGKVGIGLGNGGVPAYKMHVVGDRIRLGNNTLATAKTIDLRVDGAGIDVTANNGSLYLGSNTGHTILQELSGRVGVGVNAPAYKMHVVGNRIRLGSSALATAKTIDMRTDGTQVDIMANNAHLFLGSSTGNTIIQGFGRNVGIGTGDPTAELHVNGSENNGSTAAIKITSGTQNMILDGNEIDALGDHLYLNHNSGTHVIMANGGGSVRIGAFAAPTAKLDVSGDVKCFNLFTNSDRRYKTEIQTLAGALDKILAMRGTSYGFDAKQIPSDYKAGKQTGFIAQEMQTVMPELVNTDTEGMMSVNYIGVIPVLVEAMKEQHEVIAEKESRIAVLESETAVLKSRLAAIEAALGIATDRQIAPEKASTETKISPNPSTGQVKVSIGNISGANQVVVHILDSNSRELAQHIVAAGEQVVDFDLSRFPAGVYVAQVVADGKVQSTNKVQLLK